MNPLSTLGVDTLLSLTIAVFVGLSVNLIEENGPSICGPSVVAMQDGSSRIVSNLKQITALLHSVGVFIRVGHQEWIQLLSYTNCESYQVICHQNSLVLPQ